MSRKALFAGLVFNVAGQPVGVGQVGDVAQYVVPDDGFEFHVDAEAVDRAVLQALGEQIASHRDAVADGAMKMMGQDDLFTKALIDSSLNNLDTNLERLLEAGLPDGARTYLGMLGFRVIINHHGEVVRIEQPGVAASGDEGE